MSDKRKYRQFTPKQGAEIVLAGLRGDRTWRDVCRESRSARPCTTVARPPLDGGKAALATSRDKPPEAAELAELRKKVGPAGASALGRKTYELEILENSGGPGVSVRVAGARAVVAAGRTVTAIAPSLA